MFFYHFQYVLEKCPEHLIPAFAKRLGISLEDFGELAHHGSEHGPVFDWKLPNGPQLMSILRPFMALASYSNRFEG